MMSHTSPTLRLSPLFTKTSQALASHSEGYAPGSGSGLSSQDTSDSSSSSPYVLNIASLPSHYAISTSAPSNAIKVLDKRTLGFVASLGTSGSTSSSNSKTGKPSSGSGSGVTTRQAHEGSITSLKSYTRFLGEKKGGLMSSGKDGRVVLWDERTPGGEGNLTMYTPSNGSKFRSLLCCDMAPDGYMVAAGTELQGDDALIVYWDPRNASTPLRTHSQTHSDDITVVQFAPLGLTIKSPLSSDPSILDSELSPISSAASVGLLSASSDGLLSLSNANEDDEDEAVLVTSNWGCSIAQVGWIGKEGIWASSDMETFSTWSCELEQRLNVNIRQPSLHGDLTWVTDYTITCHAAADEEARMKRPLLSTFVGSNEGDVALISTPNPLPVSSKNKPQHTNPIVKPWNLHTTYTHNHSDIVRSLLVDEENGVIVTGGEDSKLCVWKDETVFESGDLWRGPDEEDAGEEMDVTMENGSQVNGEEHRGKKREWDVDGDTAMDDEQQEGKRLKR
ncbi:hypothetical protein BKA70DRAFT_1259249 [Coprinopsis sp. MPI-PUGE-AT-0042]|nr:hypothetical protein BKA70DRAFT_1259249 [Coprinopsis sp. MPI-PUGE-AT-0042]